MKDPRREEALIRIAAQAREDYADALDGPEGARIDVFLQVLAGERTPDPVTPNRYLHRRMYMPGLRAQPYWEAEHFPVAALLQRRYALIRAEAEHLLATPGVFLVRPGEAHVGDSRVDGGRLDGAWNAWYLQRYFKRQSLAAVHTPISLRSLDGCAVSREALLSVVGPGTAITLHSDELNFVTTLYLPLVTTPGATITFDRQPRELRAGECFAADSTFLHESFNNSAQWRVILIVDLWHVDLTALEVRFLGDVMPRADAVMRGVAPPAA